MLIYSATLNAFLKRLKIRTRQILSQEMSLTVRRERFEWRDHLIPFHLVAFEDPSKLGYFDWPTYQIGFNKKLLYRAHPQVLDNILRHELAHFYCYLLFPEKSQILQDHGPEFRDVCRRFGWGKNVYQAYTNIDFENSHSLPDKEFEKIFQRIQKLLNLSSSNNSHEAEAATLKANQLLLKYNINFLEQGATDHQNQEVCVKRVCSEKRLSAKLNALYDILQHFYVQPVFNRAPQQVYLEVVGSRINVELADYIGKYLVYEFERLWKKVQKENPHLKGVSQKNSYIMGLSKGFISKLQKQKLQHSPETQKALVIVEKNLKSQVKMAFPRLASAGKSQGKINREAIALGAKHGLDLSLRAGVTQSKPSFSLPQKSTCVADQ